MGQSYTGQAVGELGGGDGMDLLVDRIRARRRASPPNEPWGNLGFSPSQISWQFVDTSSSNRER